MSYSFVSVWISSNTFLWLETISDNISSIGVIYTIAAGFSRDLKAEVTEKTDAAVFFPPSNLLHHRFGC